MLCFSGLPAARRLSSKQTLLGVAAFVGFVLAAPLNARAQEAAAGMLMVTGTVESSLSLVFETEGRAELLAHARRPSTAEYRLVATMNRTSIAPVSDRPVRFRVVAANSGSPTYSVQSALAPLHATHASSHVALVKTSYRTSELHGHGPMTWHTLNAMAPLRSWTRGGSQRVDVTAISD